MLWHSADLHEIIQSLSSDTATGLSSSNAEKKLAEFGENVLAAKKPKTILQRFFAQFKDFMVIILIIAAVISFGVSLVEKKDYYEPLIIVAIIIINAVMGTVQESKAEKALEALKNMAAPHAKVIRGGTTSVIASKELVPGDILLLEAGDFVPADARLIEAASLKVEESALTGESVAVEKDAAAEVGDTAPLGDRLNMVYSGCSVAYGRSKAIVVSTGMNTEMGKIAALLENEEEGQTPLQKNLAGLGKYLGIIALAVCAVIFVIGVLHEMSLIEMFMTAVSLAVAAIPEGLPAIVTIVLAIGVQRMVTKSAIIRRLPAVETLGSASVICSDKTGTLTQNRMTVKRIWASQGQSYTFLPEETLHENLYALLKMAVLCCDGTVEILPDKTEKHVGDPTETAIVLAALKNGINKKELFTTYARVAEIPFDSDRKLMTTVNMIDGKPMAIVKGAFDVLSSRCISGNLEEAVKINEEMAKSALRVIAVAYKPVDSIPAVLIPEELENGLIFGGLIGMIDPPRPEAKAAVATCVKAGIKTVMITGDHVITASAIAKELGILKDEKEAVTGAQLQAMTDEELLQNIRNYSVYARVSPEDKIRIVKAWQKSGEIVSMTGDGVNDAPALKAADIGCAMGITGTDVAKGAADMTLTDDNFATIVVAVKEGRGIYDNIRKAVQFLLSCNLGEILTVFIAMVANWGAPLLAVQLLLINLVTDGLPALALGMEPPESDIMNRKPRKKTDGLFSGGLGLRIALEGVLFGVITLTGYYLGRFVFFDDNVSAGQTMAFLVLSISQLFHAFNIRSSHSIFQSHLLSNKYMLGAFAVSLAVVLFVALVPPVAVIFKLTSLSPSRWLYVLLISLVPVAVMEISKLIRRLAKKQ